jgi:hypothetical protein
MMVSLMCSVIQKRVEGMVVFINTRVWFVGSFLSKEKVNQSGSA